jgi:GWxTD domain-containing protein
MKNKIFLRSVCFLTSVVVPLLITLSCKTISPASDSKDLSYLYNPTKNSFNPQFNIINQSDESSVLSVKFFSNEMFFSEANPQGVPISSILISVNLYNINQGRVLADTAIQNISIERETGKQEYIYRIPLKVEKGTDYIAEVRVFDKLRLKVVQSFVPFNTLNEFNRYNFVARGHFKKNELFNPILRVNEYMNLVYLRKSVDSIFISYYKPFKEVPDPPMMMLPEKTLNYKPDRVIAVAYSDTLPMMFPKEGIYFCSVSRDIKEGYTIINPGSMFPKMTTPEEMIEPLAYLAPKEELDSLLLSVKPKIALDNFWIKCGGNIDKARELIRIFYTRVQYSNYYFTSYKEGWRSERGMIYIIYGPPDKVYKTAEGENWGYRKSSAESKWGNRYKTNDEYLFFNFKKKNTPYSDNDYYLSRNETLVTYWDQAIADWRKGIVFRLDNPSGI